MSQHHADQPSNRSDAVQGRPLPKYKLILQDFADDPMAVVRILMELVRFCLSDATAKTWEARRQGHATLFVTHKERAELYVEQFAARGLAVTIEPAG